MTIIAKVVDKFLSGIAGSIGCKTRYFGSQRRSQNLVGRERLTKRTWARPMARVVTELIKRPLADEILFGVLESGGVAHVDVKEGELVIRTERHEKATTKLNA